MSASPSSGVQAQSFASPFTTTLSRQRPAHLTPPPTHRLRLEFLLRHVSPHEHQHFRVAPDEQAHPLRDITTLPTAMSSARGGERGRAKPTRSKTFARGGAHNSTRTNSGNASDSDGGSGSSFRGRGRGATTRGSSTRGAPSGPHQKQAFGGPQARPPSRSNNSTPQANGSRPASAAGLPWPQRYETVC